MLPLLGFDVAFGVLFRVEGKDKKGSKKKNAEGVRVKLASDIKSRSVHPLSCGKKRDVTSNPSKIFATFFSSVGVSMAALTFIACLFSLGGG